MKSVGRVGLLMVGSIVHAGGRKYRSRIRDPINPTGLKADKNSLPGVRKKTPVLLTGPNSCAHVG